MSMSQIGEIDGVRDSMKGDKEVKTSGRARTVIQLDEAWMTRLLLPEGRLEEEASRQGERILTEIELNYAAYRRYVKEVL